MYLAKAPQMIPHAPRRPPRRAMVDGGPWLEPERIAALSQAETQVGILARRAGEPLIKAARSKEYLAPNAQGQAWQIVAGAGLGLVQRRRKHNHIVALYPVGGRLQRHPPPTISHPWLCRA